MYCRNCGEENPKEANYCSKCGLKLAGASESAVQENTKKAAPERTIFPIEGMKIRCPNPECNILFKVEGGQRKCRYCGTDFSEKFKGKGKAYCNICSKEIIEDKYHVIPPEKGDKEVKYLHLECADLVDEALDEETKGVNYPAAIGYGVLFGLGASVLWYLSVVISGYMLGIVAVAVGWLVAKGVSIGAGYKRGRKIQIISLSIVAVSLFFAEYLILNHFFQQALAEEGIEGLSLSISKYPSFLIEYLTEEDNMVDLLFWGIALFEGFVIPGRRKVRGYKIAEK